MHDARELVTTRAAFERHEVAVLAILAAVAVGACVISPVTGSDTYLLAPVIGVATIIYSIIGRSVGGALLGVLELFFPVVLVFAVLLLIAHGM